MSNKWNICCWLCLSNTKTTLVSLFLKSVQGGQSVCYQILQKLLQLYPNLRQCTPRAVTVTVNMVHEVSPIFQGLFLNEKTTLNNKETSWGTELEDVQRRDTNIRGREHEFVTSCDLMKQLRGSLSRLFIGGTWNVFNAFSARMIDVTV